MMRESGEEFLRRINFDLTTQSITKLHKETEELLDEINEHLTECGYVDGCVDEKELDDYCMEIFGETVEDYFFPKEGQNQEKTNKQDEKEMDFTESKVRQIKGVDSYQANAEKVDSTLLSNRKSDMSVVPNEVSRERRAVVPSEETVADDSDHPTHEKRFKSLDGAIVPSVFRARAALEDLRFVLQRRRAIESLTLKY